MALKYPSEPNKLRALKTLNKALIMSHAEMKKMGMEGVRLRRLTQEGLIHSLGNGIYSTTSLDPFIAAIFATAKYYPKAVISGTTALQIHELGQDYADRIDVDIPRETSIRNQMLKVHRVPKTRIIGIQKMKFHQRFINIYDVERTLCEAYRISKAGPEFFRALKRYVVRGKVNSEKIQKYDLALKTHVLLHLQQEQADA